MSQKSRTPASTLKPASIPRSAPTPTSSSASRPSTSTSRSISPSRQSRQSVDNHGIMTAICILANQTYQDSARQIKRIVKGTTIPSKQLDHKNRLFSDITFGRAENSLFTANSVDHKFPIDSITYVMHEGKNQLRLSSETKQFTKTVVRDSGQKNFVTNLQQTAYFVPATGEINIVLSDMTNPDAPKFNYKSVYKYNQITGDIKVFPYTEKEHKTVKPIQRRATKLTKLDGDVVNIYAYLNNLQGEKVTINTSLADLNVKLLQNKTNINELKDKPMQTINDIEQIKQYEFVEKVLENDRTKQDFDKKLKQWKNDYDNWTHKPGKIVPIEEHAYKFEYKEIGKPKLSRTMERLITRLKPYDTRIMLEADTEVVTVKEEHKKKQTQTINISKPIKYGVYPPYLVSDIIRFKEVGKNDAIDALALSKKNIKGFCEFIYGFKSVLFTTISLYHQLMQIKSKTQCAGITNAPHTIINFNYANFYNNTTWADIKVEPILTHNLIFSPCESISKCLKILVNEPKETIHDQVLLPVDEPLFGVVLNTGIEDFDKLYYDRLDSSLFSFLQTGVESNYDKFLKNKFQEVEELLDETDRETNKKYNLEEENDFPRLNKQDDQPTDQPKRVPSDSSWSTPLKNLASLHDKLELIKPSSPKPYGRMKMKKQEQSDDDDDDDDDDGVVRLGNKTIVNDAFGQQVETQYQDAHTIQTQYKQKESSRKARLAAINSANASIKKVETPKQRALNRKINDFVDNVIAFIETKKRGRDLNSGLIADYLKQKINLNKIKIDANVEKIANKILKDPKKFNDSPLAGLNDADLVSMPDADFDKLVNKVSMPDADFDKLVNKVRTNLKLFDSTDDLEEEDLIELLGKKATQPTKPTKSPHSTKKPTNPTKSSYPTKKPKRDIKQVMQDAQYDDDYDWEKKYIKYKTKYLKLKNEIKV